MDTYDFGGATFDLEDPNDREIVCFVLSQALFGEATGVYCGKSLYAARSLEAARFYLKQARQELNHLELFAEIFRSLEMKPQPAHWIIRLFSAHNNYYPLKVLMEHAIGEGMVLDIFRDVVIQTLPDSDPRIPDIKKKLRAVCREEEEHVAWGEKETLWVLQEKPWLRWPFYGILEMQLLLAPVMLKPFEGRKHKVLEHIPQFVAHVNARVTEQGRRLGIVPETRPNLFFRLACMIAGVLVFVRSQFSRSTSTLDRTYLGELGFNQPG